MQNFDVERIQNSRNEKCRESEYDDAIEFEKHKVLKEINVQIIPNCSNPARSFVIPALRFAAPGGPG